MLALFVKQAGLLESPCFYGKLHALMPCKEHQDAKAHSSQYLAAVAHIKALSKNEQIRLFSRLRKQLHGAATIDLDTLEQQVRDQRFNRGFVCPHCKSGKVIRNGTQNGRQTFECHECGKYSSEHTHTPMRGLHYPEKWLEFVEYELMGYALRKSAEILEIATSTAWAWRRKLLAAIQRLEPAELQGIVEADETYVRENRKGNKNITHRLPYNRGSAASKRGIK